jgi:hypothetical protein
MTEVVVIAAIAGLIWKSTRKPRPAVGMSCTTGHCNPKAAGSPPAKDHPITLDRPIDMAHRDDTLHKRLDADDEDMGNTSQVAQIRAHVQHLRNQEEKYHPGVTAVMPRVEFDEKNGHHYAGSHFYAHHRHN